MQTQKRIIASHIKIKTKMKVKNLLLAGLAVAAMTACSNDELVDNGVQTNEENASMQINFQFATDTRAVSDGGTDAGDKIEYETSEITAVLEYTETNKQIIVKGLTFDQQTAGGTRIYTTEPFQIEAGNNVKVYAFINPTMDITTSGLNNLKIGKQSLPDDGTLNYLTSTIATPSKFMMSNVDGEPAIINIVGGTVNKAKISVERISAKLTEETNRTTDNKYEVTNPSFTGPKVYVQILQHTYTNLADDSYVLGGRTEGWKSFLHPYLTGDEVTEKSYRWMDEAGTTYVLENLGTTWNTATSTSVLYQGQVFFDDETEPAGTFYSRLKLQADQKTWKAQIYKNWEELGKEINLTDIDPNDDAALAKRSIKRYEGGKCYYEAPIEHFNVGANIARNNWYKMSVKTIKDLGYPKPVPPTPENETQLIMSVSIAPWTIHVDHKEL